MVQYPRGDDKVGDKAHDGGVGCFQHDETNNGGFKQASWMEGGLPYGLTYLAGEP